MKPISLLCAVIVSLLLTQYSLADSESPPIPFVVVSQNGEYFFKMIPPKTESCAGLYVTTREAFGVAYELDENGSFKELWKTSRWYSFDIFLSDDGQYLVRMGPWNEIGGDISTDLAVAFYKNGNLLKKYSVADLVKSKSKIRTSISHYVWLAKDNYLDSMKDDPHAQLRLDTNNVFHLKTIDGIIYQFDVTTGEIKKTEKH